jgi:hypothetical protein
MKALWFATPIYNLFENLEKTIRNFFDEIPGNILKIEVLKTRRSLLKRLMSMVFLSLYFKALKYTSRHLKRKRGLRIKGRLHERAMADSLTVSV